MLTTQFDDFSQFRKQNGHIAFFRLGSKQGYSVNVPKIRWHMK